MYKLLEGDEGKNIQVVENKKLTREEKLFLRILEINLFKLSKQQKGYKSKEEREWILQHLAPLGENNFDSYGNYHKLIEPSEGRLYVCPINEKRSGYLSLEMPDERGIIKNISGGEWEPGISGGTAIGYTLMEQGVGGRYIFCRLGGYKWLTENEQEVFKEIIIEFIFMGDKEQIVGDKAIYINQGQLRYFPKHRIHHKYRNKIASYEESWAFSVGELSYHTNGAHLGINPGVETEPSLGLNYQKFLEMGLYLRNNKLISIRDGGGVIQNTKE